MLAPLVIEIGEHLSNTIAFVAIILGGLMAVLGLVALTGRG